ncbi:MAG: polyphosphate polymerase domain-containing protein [Planctomycetota bacterium]
MSDRPPPSTTSPPSSTTSVLTPLAADLSPSLARRQAGGPRAFEWKFLVPPEIATAIRDRLRNDFQPDSHADPALGGAYLVRSTYLDTPDWHVLRAIGRHASGKFRVRAYGDSPIVFLERKTKSGRAVRKRRDQLEADAWLEALAASRVAPPETAFGTVPQGAALHNGDSLAESFPVAQSTTVRRPLATHWFLRQALRSDLRPVCQVRYRREAFYASTSAGRLRLTFDRGLVAARVAGWSFAVMGQERELSSDLEVCEFKFAGDLPLVFKRVIQDFRLSPGSHSKYRRAMRRLGGADSASGGGDV